MNATRLLVTSVLTAVTLMSATVEATDIAFSGYNWTIRPSGRGGPGPNNWDPTNVFVDANGYLHLKITQNKSKWSCAEVYTTVSPNTNTGRLGFGRYQFQTGSRIDTLDPNVVLGLFNYPTSDVGPDGTNEIDIEYARWGNASWPNGNFTVWPVFAKATASPPARRCSLPLIKFMPGEPMNRATNMFAGLL